MIRLFANENNDYYKNRPILRHRSLGFLVKLALSEYDTTELCYGYYFGEFYIAPYEGEHISRIKYGLPDLIEVDSETAKLRQHIKDYEDFGYTCSEVVTISSELTVDTLYFTNNGGAISLYR